MSQMTTVPYPQSEPSDGSLALMDREACAQTIQV
jgi:hypothetical protein